MADLAAWLGGIGGAIGALSGPTAVYVAIQQRRLEKHMRDAPPVEVGAHLLVLIRIAGDASQTYRDQAWWQNSGGRQAVDGLRQLEPMVGSVNLRSSLVSVRSSYEASSSTLTSGTMAQNTQISTVANQATRARELETRAKRALKLWQDQS